MLDTGGHNRLVSDASKIAAGSALYQYRYNGYYRVDHSPKKLPNPTINYSITELELCGFVINV